MDIGKRDIFLASLIQGLIVVFFIYVLAFNVSLFIGKKGGETAPFKPVVISITREETTHPDPPMPDSSDNVALTPQHVETAALPPEHSDHAAPEHGEEQTAAPKPDFSDLIEATPIGPMPKKSASGRTAFETWKRPFTDTGNPVIALAVMDYGLSEQDSKNLLDKLSPEVTLVLNPYAQNPAIWKDLAEAQSRELWVSIPLLNKSHPVDKDQGPQALIAQSDFKYNQEKFIWALTRMTGYVGVAAFTDDAFINAQSTLKALLSEGYNRGLGYMELNPAGLQGLELEAVEKNFPYTKGFAVLDETTPNANQWLAALEQEARNSGFALGVIAAPYPLVIDSIAAWQSGLAEKGLSLAPASALARAKSDSVEAAPPPPPAPIESHVEPQH